MNNLQKFLYLGSNKTRYFDNFNRSNENPLSTNGWATKVWKIVIGGPTAITGHSISSNKFYTYFHISIESASYIASSFNSLMPSRNINNIIGSLKISKYASTSGGTGTSLIGFHIGGDTTTQNQGIKILLNLEASSAVTNLVGLRLMRNSTVLLANTLQYTLPNSTQYNFDFEMTKLNTKIWIYQTGTTKPSTPTYTYNGDLTYGVTLNGKLCGIYSYQEVGSNVVTVYSYIDDYTLLVS